MTTSFKEDTSTLSNFDKILTINWGSSNIEWGDYNNDSKLDFLYSNSGINKIYKNTGTGFIEDNSVKLPDGNIIESSWRDFNNDSKLDFLLTKYDNNGVAFYKQYKNTGSGYVEDNSIALPPSTVVKDGLFTWGDHNNDSKPDLLLTGYDTNYTTSGISFSSYYNNYTGVSKLYKNTGTSFIEETSANLPGVGRALLIGYGIDRNTSAEWADYNNDNKLDLFLTGYSQMSTSGLGYYYPDQNDKISKLYKNTGTGFIEDSLIKLPSTSADPLSWTDYNSDSKPDLLFTDGKLYKNTGNGFIEDSVFEFPPASSAEWADFNNDSKLDVVLTTIDNGQKVNKLYLNTSDSSNGGNNIDTLTGQNIMRFWNVETKSHFFTSNPVEVRDSLNNPSYNAEGNEFDVPKAGTPGTLPVYRYKNQKVGTYFYTFQGPSDITPNYPDLVVDGIAFNAFTSETKPSDAVPIYRFYNKDRSQTAGSPVHFFTSTESNKQDVIRNYPSFKYEEPGFYAYPAEFASSSNNTSGTFIGV